MELKIVPGILTFVLITVYLCALPASCAALEEKVCHGTHMGFAEPSNPDANFQEMRDRYTGCTFVQGNLELTWMRSENLDLSFLRHIREVTGYVLLFNVGVRRVPLTNLQIIRGEKLLKTTAQREAFAFLATTVTTQYLEMPALREIQRGSVGFLKSYNLCHIKNVAWKYINQDWRYNIFDITNSDTECLPCDSSCSGGCWGPGPQNCQRINTLKCHSECLGKCFGEGYTECCHSTCAVGCSSRQPNDCIACKHYDDDGTCMVNCPKGKYKYGATCVRECPQHMLKDSDACVPDCPPGKMVVQGECIPCQGLCHKVCDGVDVIHSGNVDQFQNCTTIQGSIEIKDITFSGFQKFHANFIPGPLYEEMHPDALEVFSSVKEITGYLSISGSHSAFKDLSFLRNLKIIKGDILAESQAGLSIQKTSLKTLGLRSLRTISKGGITIRENKDLCLLDQSKWNEIKMSSTYSIQIQGNRPENDCVKDGYICHHQCSSDGCWGTAANECFSCVNYKLKESCIGPCLNSSQSNGDEICFAKVFIPGLSLYIINENTKELVDGHAWDDSLTSAYVTTHKQYQIWMQRLPDNEKPVDTDETTVNVGTVETVENIGTTGNDQGNPSNRCSGLKAKWIDAPEGLVPTYGLVSTNDSNCNHYVGRTTHEGDLIPGKFFIHNRELYISWKGKEFTYKTFQLLTGHNYEWIPATGKKIPACAVKGGQTVDGTPLYIGRVLRPNDCTEIGKVNPLDGLLYIGYFSKEYTFPEYDILVFKTIN